MEKFEPQYKNILRKLQVKPKATPDRRTMTRKQFRDLPVGTRYISKNGRLGMKQTFRENMEYFLFNLLKYIIHPFYWAGVYIGRFLRTIFMKKMNFQDNGICGPGYSSWHEEHFNWGLLSFILVVAFVIIYFIFLR